MNHVKHLQQTNSQQQSKARAAKLSFLIGPEWCFDFFPKFHTSNLSC